MPSEADVVVLRMLTAGNGLRLEPQPVSHMRFDLYDEGDMRDPAASRFSEGFDL